MRLAADLLLLHEIKAGALPLETSQASIDGLDSPAVESASPHANCVRPSTELQLDNHALAEAVRRGSP